MSFWLMPESSQTNGAFQATLLYWMLDAGCAKPTLGVQVQHDKEFLYVHQLITNNENYIP
jgi:hypothetical protein